MKTSTKSFGTVIESIGTYTPKKKITSKDLVKNCKTLVKIPLERATGIKARYHAEENEFSFTMAAKAINDCFKSSKYSPEQIDLIISCNISKLDGPRHLFSIEPGTALKLKEQFSLVNAVAFDINNACAGMFTGFKIAHSLIRTGRVKTALIVSGEYISHLSDTAQKEVSGLIDSRIACLTLGDCGAAVLLNASDDASIGFQDIELATLGKYSELCIAKPSELTEGEYIMETNSFKLAKVGIKQSVKHAIGLIERYIPYKEDFKTVIMHQISKRSLKEAVHMINSNLDKNFGLKDFVKQEQTFETVEEFGNTASTSHSLVLKEHIMNKNIHDGKIFFSLTASGLTVGSAVYQLDDMPNRIRHHQNGGGPAPKTGRKRAAQPFTTRLQAPKIRIESVGLLDLARPRSGNSVQLAHRAAQQCIERSSHDKNDIDLLIYCGVHKTDFISEPANAAFLTGSLEINQSDIGENRKNTFAFDVHNGEPGWLIACYLMSHFAQNGDYHTALLVTSEVEEHPLVQNLSTRPLTETASAVLIDSATEGKTGIGNFYFEYFTEYAARFTSFADNARGPLSFRTICDEGYHAELLSCLKTTCDNYLRGTGLSLDDYSYILAPQISEEFLTQFARLLGVSEDKVIVVENNSKDLYTSSAAYCLEHIQTKGAAQGELGLILSGGFGIQTACATYYF